MKSSPIVAQLFGLYDFFAIGKTTVEVSGFAADSVLIDDPRGRHEVSVRVIFTVQMHIESNGNTLIDNGLREVPRKLYLLIQR